MDVIGHQAVGVHDNPEPLPISPQFFQVGLIVVFSEEGLSPLITSDYDVVENSRGK